MKVFTKSMVKLNSLGASPKVDKKCGKSPQHGGRDGEKKNQRHIQSVGQISVHFPKTDGTG